MVTDEMVDAAIKANTDAKLFGGEPRNWVRAALEAALSAAEPVACEYGHDNGDGTYSPTYARWPLPPHVKPHGDMPARLFYSAPPAPSVAVKALQWDDDGGNLKARMGDREWMLNVTADGKTWAGSTRPFVFGRNLAWSSVPDCSFLTLEAAKAACQADCQSRYAALSAQVQDVALFGPYAHLNGYRKLSEDEWSVDSDPDVNDGERFSIPLYSLIEPPFPAAPAKQEG